MTRILRTSRRRRTVAAAAEPALIGADYWVGATSGTVPAGAMRTAGYRGIALLVRFGVGLAPPTTPSGWTSLWTDTGNNQATNLIQRILPAAWDGIIASGAEGFVGLHYRCYEGADNIGAITGLKTEGTVLDFPPSGALSPAAKVVRFLFTGQTQMEYPANPAASGDAANQVTGSIGSARTGVCDSGGLITANWDPASKTWSWAYQHHALCKIWRT